MLLLRVAVSLALLAYLVLVTVPPADRAKIVAIYARSDLLYLLAAICLTFLDRLLSAWKWLMLLRARQPGLEAGPVMQVFFVSTFLGYFLPSSIGGDAIRIFSLSRLNRDLAGSTSSVVLDRAFGTLGLLGIAAVALLPAVGSTVSLADASIIWTLTVGALAGVLVLSSRTCNAWALRLIGPDRQGPIGRRLLRLVESFRGFVERKWTLVRVFLFSLAVQVIRVLIVLFLGLSLRFEVDPVVYFIYVPIITVITFLPISIAGVGVREAAFLFFFTRVGLPAYACISLSLLYFSMGIVATLPGAAVYALSGFGRRKAQA